MRRPWTADEDLKLIQHSNKTASWSGWAKLLPGRSYSAINVRRHALGITVPRVYTDWTTKQRSALIKGMRALCKEAEHDPYQCMAELNRIMKKQMRRTS